MTRKDKSIQSPSGGAPSLTIDWELYGQMLDECDWDEEQKREFISCLWSIVVAFVDLGFDVHPIQQVIDDDLGCGQDGDESKSLPAVVRSLVNSDQAAQQRAAAVDE